MDFLPEEIENIILDYKYQLEIAEKKEKVHRELQTRIEYQQYSYHFSMLRKDGKDIYFYYSEYFNRLVMIRNDSGVRHIASNTYITYL